MLYDTETRTLIARERAALLRTQATVASEQQARRWLSDRLITAGLRIAPECTPRSRPVRGAGVITRGKLGLRELEGGLRPQR